MLNPSARSKVGVARLYATQRDAGVPLPYAEFNVRVLARSPVCRDLRLGSISVLLLVGVPPSFSPPLNLRIPAVRKPRNGRSASFIATAYLARWATISRLASRATRPAPMIVADAAPVQFPYPMSHKPGTAVDC